MNLHKNTGSGVLRILASVLVLVVFTTSCGRQSENTSPTPGDILAFRNHAESVLQLAAVEGRISGGISAIVISEGQEVYSGAVGWADNESRVAMSPDTPMPLGSVSKLFTAVAFMTLVEDGHVTLDTPVGEYLPSLNMADGAENQFTPRQLLTHHSGLPGDLFADWLPENPGPEELRSLYRLLEGFPLVTEPGELFSYSNVGYSLLGLIIEEITGQDYAAFIQSQIFDPLGMKNSLIYTDGAESDLPLGYWGKTSIPIPQIRDIPAGGITTSAADLGLFFNELYSENSSLINQSTLDEMLKVQNQNNEVDRLFEIGLGFWLINPWENNLNLASHGGEIPPFHTLLISDPDSRSIVFVSTNDHSSGGQLALNTGIKLARDFFAWKGVPEKATPEKQAFVELDDETRKQYEGSYGTIAGILELKPFRNGFNVTMGKKRVFLGRKPDGRYKMEYRLFGIIPVAIPSLEHIEVDLFESGGKTWMGLSMMNIYLGAFSRLEEVVYPPEFEDYTGEYEVSGHWTILNDETRILDDISVVKNGDRYAMKVGIFGQSVEMALRPLESGQIITDGTGRGMGEPVAFIQNPDGYVMKWSGMELRKR